ncbi:uncharacterized protein N7515_008836 [Penicillium bovifimosum]|uniref:Uncharacterized protein n=1 Tax=Penicillium bovifimosum TaxID=126998 RepID=A0A9W9GNT7_9EURO|nr:uncharacterized protein N7515_008836 [Penicillium bovifimosum]KAJ5125011.1 hypothetical protein N7515_008836 [Penicillium bovifimosum]
MPPTLYHHLDPILEAEYANIVRIVETQIEILTFKAWRRHEVIENLDMLCHHLAIQAAIDERKPRNWLAGHALFQRFCMTLRLCVPEAIVTLQSYGTTYEVDDDLFDWEDEEELERDAVDILKDALRDAQSTEWYI